MQPNYEEKADSKSNPVSEKYKRLRAAFQRASKYQQEAASDREKTIVNINQDADTKAEAKVPLQDKQAADETINEEDSVDGSNNA